MDGLNAGGKKWLVHSLITGIGNELYNRKKCR